MTEVEKERIKLSANYANGMAIATFAIGTLAPILSLFYGEKAEARPVLVILTVSTVCLIASMGLHYAARRILRGLQP